MGRPRARRIAVFDTVEFTKERALRFASSIDFFGPHVAHNMSLGRCWTWTGHRNHCGYGVLHNVMAHRISFEIRHGRIPHIHGHGSAHILHECDNPSCVNPSHLRAGTRSENIQEAVSRGRHVGRHMGVKTHRLIRRVIGDIEAQLRSCERRVTAIESICANLDQSLDDGQLQIHNGDTHG